MHRSSQGQASISLVLLVGGLASAAVITIALVAISAINNGYGADQQQRARAAALAGIEDGAIRITRNPGDAGTYSLPSGVATATVTISPNTPSSGMNTVSSQASYGFRRVNLSAVYSVDPVTGVPIQVSLTQL